MLLPIGDDAAALSFNGTLVTSVDMLVEETDVPPGMTMYQAGWKAVVSAVSDLAAKGAAPKYLLVSLGLKPSTDLEDFKQLIAGLYEAAVRYNAAIVGGDINSSSSNVFSVTAIGEADKLIPRDGAKPGDLLAVTGYFGKTYAGLHALLNKRSADNSLLESILKPIAKVREGIAIARSGYASSSIDSSDGLAESLYLLSEASGVGFEVREMPLDPIARDYCSKNDLDVFDATFYGGEEYEIVFTFKREYSREMEETLKNVGSSLLVIGEAIEQQVVRFVSQDVEKIIERKGWQHFISQR